MYVLFHGGLAALVLALFVADQASRHVEWTADDTFAVISAAFALYILLRCPIVGLRITGRQAIRRGWFSKAEIDLSAVTQVYSPAYSGVWNWSGRSWIFNMVTMHVGEGMRIELPELCGSPKFCQAIVEEVCATARAFGAPLY